MLQLVVSSPRRTISLKTRQITNPSPSNNFIIGLITPPLVQNTEWGAYLFFAIFCVLSGIWAFFFVRETNGKTLEEMDGVFGDSASAEDEERRRRIEDILRIRDGDADSRAEGEVGVLQGDKEAE